MRNSKLNNNHLGTRAANCDYDDYRDDARYQGMCQRKGLCSPSGVEMEFSCPICSYEETVEFLWPEVIALSQGKPVQHEQHMGLKKLPSGWSFGLICRHCLENKANVYGGRNRIPKEAIRRISIRRALEIGDLNQWIAYAKQKGFVR